MLRSANSRVAAALVSVLGVGLVGQAPIVVVPMGSVWAFLADGADHGTAWRSPEFDDSAWSRGPAQLGYGEADEATVVPAGPGTTHFVTTYFRTAFSIDPSMVSRRVFGELIYDDGAVVYVNGTEVFRVNMPAGPVAFNRLAADSGEYEPAHFTIAPGALRPGRNVVAVEVHQGDTTSSDVSFALELTLR